MIDIVVAAKSGSDDLKTCLHSLQTYTQPSEYRITIAAPELNRDICLEAARSVFPDSALVTLTGPERPWRLLQRINFSKSSSGVLFIDAAMRFSEGWFASLQHGLSSEPAAGMMSFKLVSNEGLILSSDMRPNPRRVLFFKDRDEGQADYLRRTDILPDFCFYIRHDLMQILQDPDEDETDFCALSRCVREAGHRLIYNGRVSIVYKNTELITRISEGMFNPDRKNAELLAPDMSGFPREDSHAADRLMSAAIRALYDGNYEAALQFSSQLNQSHPEFTELWVSALAHVRLGHYGEALTILEVLVRRNPASYSARNYLTFCLRQLGLDREAGDLTERMFACITKNIELKRSRAGTES